MCARGGAHAPTVSAPGGGLKPPQRTMTSRQFIGGDNPLSWVQDLSPTELAAHQREMAAAQRWHDSLSGSSLTRTYSGLPDPAAGGGAGAGARPPTASQELARVASLAMDERPLGIHAPNLTEAQLAEIWGEEGASHGAEPPPPKVRRRLGYKKYKGG